MGESGLYYLLTSLILTRKYWANWPFPVLGTPCVSNAKLTVRIGGLLSILRNVCSNWVSNCSSSLKLISTDQESLVVRFHNVIYRFRWEGEEIYLHVEDVGAWAAWSNGWQPAHSIETAAKVIVKVPFNPNHSMILCRKSKATDECMWAFLNPNPLTLTTWGDYAQKLVKKQNKQLQRM